MTVAEATPEHLDEAVDRHDRAFLGHPKGLGYLSAVEFCERFSYYSMQNLLALYMVNYLLPERFSSVLGLGWLQQARYGGADGQVLASAIFGDYTSLVYLTPILGGFLADRWLGRRAALVAGAVVMSLGHFMMAFEGAFLFALATLIVGVGLFKGNIASQVGFLYREGDLRRAMAFQIFYIAINVSVIIAPFISGTLGEKVGWHYGFGCAGVVMVLGLLVYLKAGPWLPPDNKPSKDAGAAPKDPLTGKDWSRVLAVVVLVPIMATALLTNQEIFNAYLIWADQHFNLTFFDYRIPTTWLTALDAALSFSMLVAVAAFWNWRARKTGTEPDELGKMIIGSFFTIAGGPVPGNGRLDPGRRQDRPVLAIYVPPAQLDRLQPHPAGQPGAVYPARPEADQCNGDWHLLPRVLPREPDRRPRRRLVLDLGHHAILAVPRRHGSGGSGGVLAVQGLPRQAPDGRSASGTGSVGVRP